MVRQHKVVPVRVSKERRNEGPATLHPRHHHPRGNQAAVTVECGIPPCRGSDRRRGGDRS